MTNFHPLEFVGRVSCTPVGFHSQCGACSVQNCPAVCTQWTTPLRHAHSMHIVVRCQNSPTTEISSKPLPWLLVFR